MRQIVEDPEVRKAFLSIITDPEHTQFTALWRSAVAYAYGRPPQMSKVDSPANQGTGEQIMNRLVDALPVLLAIRPEMREKMRQALGDTEHLAERTN